jgi:hypothetical protein
VGDQALDSLLTRRDFGTLSSEALQIELRTALERLADAIATLAPRAETIRLWNSELLPARDDAFARASRAVTMLRFREAVREIHRCRDVMTVIVHLLEAVDAADRAAEAMEAVWTLAQTARLRGLPAIASVAQIVDVARSMIMEQHYIRAARAANICGRMAELLAHREKLRPDDRMAAEGRLRTIDELCTATRQFAEEPDDDPLRDGTIATLRALFDRDYTHLGLRLLTEVEMQIAGRRRFLDHCIRRYDGQLTSLNIEQMRLSVRERSWDGAVDEQWHRSIARHGGAIAEQRRRVAAASAELETALTSPGNAQRSEIA